MRNKTKYFNEDWEERVAEEKAKANAEISKNKAAAKRGSSKIGARKSTS